MDLNDPQVITAIDRAVSVLPKRLLLPGQTMDDLYQTGRLFALEALKEGKYDPARGELVNFLVRHVRNRTLNVRRAALCRSDAPCALCHSGRPCREDGEFCQSFVLWRDRQQAKIRVAVPQGLTSESQMLPAKASEDIEGRDLIRLIDEKLPMELRATYLEMQAGVSVPKPKREQVQRAVASILCEHGLADLIPDEPEQDSEAA